MKFTKRKMERSAAMNIRRYPISSVRPYQILVTPIYLYLKRNEKFLALKGPLDFFLPDEMEKLKEVESLFTTSFIDQTVPFLSAAQSVKAILNWRPKQVSSNAVSAGQVSKDENKTMYPEIQLPVTPFELSDAIIRVIGPLWEKGPSLEPFFVTVFVDELCGAVTEEMLKMAKDVDVETYECSLIRSSWVVFLALHIGYCELNFLNRLRVRAFSRSLQKKKFSISTETDKLSEVISELLFSSEIPSFKGMIFKGRPERVCQKLSSRLFKVNEEFISKNREKATIFGEKGFVDV